MDRDDIPAAALTACTSCKKPCILTTTARGKTMLAQIPVDPTGNLALTVEGNTVRSRVVKPTLAFGRKDLHLPHWADCPNADSHRRKRQP